ncbi:MAG: NAD(P)/FAD-dependent oxidoreductase [Candidatus Methanoperedens sp.]|nr:NAD(P)/FAD-dependent oxidoreductase [Candidatus Methanoperedens sp.]
MGLSLMYDAIIVGAGPAGSVTARTVAHAGYDVLILEKNETCRSPCAGYISKTINFDVPDESVLQSDIKQMRTYFPDKSYHDFSLNGYVVDRPSFDISLLSKAKESGAQVMWNSPLVDISPGIVKFRNGNAPGKIIVGADGVFSKTASILGLQPQRFAACAQYHIKDIEPIAQTCEIFFDSDYAPGGYIWIYPTGENSAKVGLGMIKDKNKKSPRQNLDAFIAGSKIANRLSGKITGYIAGALPIGGLREKLVFGNVILAGDSAGMADPVTGAGINNAILAGEVAGKTIIKALENDDIAQLCEYETKIRRLLGRPLGRALEKRIKMDACCNNQLLQEHLPELWVTFKQYRV